MLSPWLSGFKENPRREDCGLMAPSLLYEPELAFSTVNEKPIRTREEKSGADICPIILGLKIELWRKIHFYI